ncbi:MAG TPA: TonB-dependent receptor [Nevskiaceae bacterium]|nr:TonB-dependent receptor [Nevskiaceae bacterium]
MKLHSALMWVVCLVPGLAAAQDASSPARSPDEVRESASPMDTVPVSQEAQAAAPPPSPPPPATGLDEIIVTAQKSAASVQDIPIAVSALKGDDLAYRGMGDMAALQRAVPSLNFGQRNGVALVTVRGVGLNIDLGGAEPAVASHVDGVYQPRVTTGSLGMADLQRVEVLRGPQGTLYGRNATGGAINYVLNKPTDTFEGSLTAGMGTFAGRDGKLTGIVSGPLVENVLNGRAMVDTSADRGWVTNETNGHTLADLRTLQGRIALSLFPHDPFSADLSVLYRRDRHLEPANLLVAPPDPLLETAFTIAPPTTTNPDDYILDSYRHVKLTEDPTGHRHTANAALTLNWDVGFANLKSLTGFQDHRIIRTYDEDTTARDIFTVYDWEDESRSWSQELNASLDGEWGRVLVGAYYFTEDYFVTTPVDIPAAGFGTGLGVQQFGDSDIESRAVFTEVTFNLGERLRLFGGVRYSEDEKDLTQTVNLYAGTTNLAFLGASAPDVIEDFLVTLFESAPNVPGAPVTVAPIVDTVLSQCTAQTTKLDFDSLDPRVGLQLDVAEDVMTYAQFQTGYKSGDTNFTSCGNSYDPEEVESTEVGLKSSWMDRRLTANFAVFNNDYTDFQVFKVEAIRGLVVNAQSARVRGAEVESVWLPLDWLQLDLTATYLDAKYREFRDTDPANPTRGEQDLEGNRLNRAPKYSFNVGVETRFEPPIPGVGQARLRVEWYRTDDVVFRPYGEPLDAQDGFDLVNAFASIESRDGVYALRLYGKNLADTQYYDYVFASQIGHRNGPSGTPRAFGAEVTVRF